MTNNRFAIAAGFGLLGLLFSASGSAAAGFECQGAGGMEASPVSTGWTISFQPTESDPEPGQCSGVGAALKVGGGGLLILPRIKRSTEVFAAARAGGTFSFEGTVVDPSSDNVIINITKISAVNIVEEEVDAAENGMGEEEPAPIEDDGNDMGNQGVGNGDCPQATAVVSIADPKDKYLNIRDKPMGQKLGKVWEGEEVSVVGICPSGGIGGNAGLVRNKGKSKDVWCEIDQPMEGCVNANFLDFEGGAEG